MADGGGAGRTFVMLLVLLGILGGAGAWNYNRNLVKEDQVPRPWRNYSDTDLEAMAAAYRGEVEQYSSRWDSARDRRADASGKGHVDDRAREFDRIYAQGRETRRLKSALADREVVLGEIEEELRLRAGKSSGWRLHMQRLLTFS